MTKIPKQCLNEQICLIILYQSTQTILMNEPQMWISSHIAVFMDSLIIIRKVITISEDFTEH